MMSSHPFGNPPLCECAEPQPCIIGAMGRRKAWACSKQPESAKCDFFQWVAEKPAAGTPPIRGPSPSSSPEMRGGPMKRTPSKVHASPRSAPYASSPSQTSPIMPASPGGIPGPPGSPGVMAGHSFQAAIGHRNQILSQQPRPGLGPGLAGAAAGMLGAPHAAAKALAGHSSILQQHLQGRPMQTMAPAVAFDALGKPSADGSSSQASSSRPSPTGSLHNAQQLAPMVGRMGMGGPKSPSPHVLGQSVGSGGMSGRSPPRSGIPKIPPHLPPRHASASPAGSAAMPHGHGVPHHAIHAGLAGHAIPPPAIGQPGSPPPPMVGSPATSSIATSGHSSILAAGPGPPPPAMAGPRTNAAGVSFTSDGKKMAPSVIFTPDGTPAKTAPRRAPSPASPAPVGTPPPPASPGPPSNAPLVNPNCDCGKPADKMTSQSMKNYGRTYFRCLTCKFFEWGPPLRAGSEPPGGAAGHASIPSMAGHASIITRAGGHAGAGGDGHHGISLHGMSRPPVGPGGASHGLPPRAPGGGFAMIPAPGAPPSGLAGGAHGHTMQGLQHPMSNMSPRTPHVDSGSPAIVGRGSLLGRGAGIAGSYTAGAGSPAHPLPHDHMSSHSSLLSGGSPHRQSPMGMAAGMHGNGAVDVDMHGPAGSFRVGPPSGSGSPQPAGGVVPEINLSFAASNEEKKKAARVDIDLSSPSPKRQTPERVESPAKRLASKTPWS